jgi:hypothetical protein
MNGHLKTRPVSEEAYRERKAKHPQFEEALYLWLIQTTEGKCGVVP